MKWIANPKIKPRLGDERFVNKFALFPKYAWCLKDNLRYKIWLIKYKEKQVYKELYQDLDNLGAFPIYSWVSIQNIIDE